MGGVGELGVARDGGGGGQGGCGGHETGVVVVGALPVGDVVSHLRGGHVSTANWWFFLRLSFPVVLTWSISFISDSLDATAFTLTQCLLGLLTQLSPNVY